MIARLDLAAIDDLKNALPRFAHKPLAHLSYLKRDQVEEVLAGGDRPGFGA